MRARKKFAPCHRDSLSCWPINFAELNGRSAAWQTMRLIIFLCARVTFFVSLTWQEWAATEVALSLGFGIRRLSLPSIFKDTWT
jgi:hypothetical protein